MRKKVTVDLAEKICKLYQDGYGTCELAKLFDLNRWTILQYLKSANLDPKRITRPYKNKYDIHFFKEYSNKSAYWAGFILADGNIHYKKKILQIGLHSQDENHLRNFAQIVKFTGPIYIDTSNDSRKIYIAGKWFAEDLYKMYGIESNKSLTTSWPEQLPKRYWSSFIRGYFDGDGSISYGKAKKLTINFTGTIKLLETIRNIFSKEISVFVHNKNEGIPPIHSNKRNKVIGQLNYSCSNAKKILDWLYSESSDCSRLERKYKKYQEHNYI